MAPTKPTMSERLDEMVGLLATRDKELDALEGRVSADVSAMEKRLDRLEDAAKNAPRVPDTAWSALVALVRVAGADALTIRLLVGGTLCAAIVLGLALVWLLDKHPELLGVAGG